MKHDLKIWPEFYDQHLSGEKTFELRKDDRGFRVGDILCLKEWEPQGHYYTGREMYRTVTHILSHRPDAGCAANEGLAPGYVIMSVELW